MTDFLSSLSSPSWWLGVVIVGLLINLIAAYLKPRLDRWLGGSSRWWETRTEKRRRARQARIRKLRESQHEQTMAALEALRSALLGVVLLMMAAILAVCLVELSKHWKSSFDVMVVRIGAFCCLLCLFLAFIVLQASTVQQAELLEARQSGDKPDKKVECA